MHWGQPAGQVEFVIAQASPACNHNFDAANSRRHRHSPGSHQDGADRARVAPRPTEFACTVCLTGQHRELVNQVLDAFELTADVDLAVMTPEQTLGGLTARVIAALDETMLQHKPDVVLVQGDTTSAFCGALAAFYHQIAVGHVEAGLRTGNKRQPFPEEVNRSLISRIADWHFAPTAHSRDALLAEGIKLSRIVVTGNTVIDALLWTRDRVRATPPAMPDDLLLPAPDESLVLVTGHRRESFGVGLLNICHAIREVADARSNVHFVYPVHLNPRVRETVFGLLGNHPRIQLTQPLAYQPFVHLMDRATIVLSDSGGVQEERPHLASQYW